MPAPRLMVSVRTDPNQSSFVGNYSRPVQVADDGAFELTGLRGSVRLVASGPQGVLKSVFRGGQDVTTKAMTLQGTEHLTDIQIVMTIDTGSVRGVVVDGRGQPVPGLFVVVFPEDPDRWFAGSPFVIATRTVASVPQSLSQRMASTPGQPTAATWTPVPGGFITSRLLAGRYWVAAMPDSDVMPPTDRESLDRLRATATSVTVTSGDAATVEVRLPK